ILADMVAHAIEFFENGRRLNPPMGVMKQVANYQESEDTIGKFLSNWCIDPERKTRVRGGDFYGMFKAWYKSEIDPDAKDIPNFRAFGIAATAAFNGVNHCNVKTYFIIPKKFRQESLVGDVGDKSQNRVTPLREPPIVECNQKTAHIPHIPHMNDEAEFSAEQPSLADF
ncbi:MAG TPA: hypothetical protein VGL71_13550, partial [Urbifossiella sp.]